MKAREPRVRASRQASLARYNFRVMMFSNWWLLVIPVAASQLTVFWNIITQRYSPTLPVATVEMVSPLLAAFLGAHVLTAEYRSGVGAIIASKPIHIGRIVLMRLAVVLGAVWGLALLSLAAFYYGMEPYDVVRPALACIPSMLFMAMLALTFATMFRHPLSGFAVAALWWALDLPPGPSVHPYLTLRSLANSIPSIGVSLEGPFITDWWVAKVLLLAGAAILFARHSRLVFALGAAPTVTARKRALGWATGLIAVYLVSGAALKVGYAYTHRGKVRPEDVTWLRRQFAPYGPLPLSALFGPTFRAYLGDIPNAWRIQQDNEMDSLGDTDEHRKRLKAALDAGGGVWGPSASDLYARLQASRTKDTALKLAIIDTEIKRYPDSPYLGSLLTYRARTMADASMASEATAAFEEVLARVQDPVYRVQALAFLARQDFNQGTYPRAVERAREWAKLAPVQERFVPMVLEADSLRASGDPAGAKAAAGRAMAAIREFRQAALKGTLNIHSGTVTRWEREAAASEGRLKSF